MNKIRVKARVAPEYDLAYLAERVRKVSDMMADINLQLELDDIYDELRKLGERRDGETEANACPRHARKGSVTWWTITD